MPEFDFHLIRGWEDKLEDLAEPYFRDLGEEIQDDARRRIGGFSNDEDAIVSTGPEYDRDGLYVDIGYDRNHPGFVLWWHEVGTSVFPPRPHLRPALMKHVN